MKAMQAAGRHFLRQLRPVNFVYKKSVDQNPFFSSFPRCTNQQQIQGLGSFSKLFHGEEADLKHILQGRYLSQRRVFLYSASCVQSPYSIQVRQVSYCLTQNLHQGKDASLCRPRALPAVCVVGQLCLRHKSGGKKSKGSSTDSDEDSDLEHLDDDDYDAPTNFKKMQIYLKSLRADSVVSSALDISRNRVDEIFYGSRLRLNGEKLLKKSKQMDEGDYVDLIIERLSDDDQLLVKRVKVVAISPERTSKDKLVVTIKVWKSPFPIEDASKAEWRQDD